MLLHRHFPAALTAIAALLAAGASCHPARAPSAVDTAMAAYIPADTLALAGLELDRIRASPLYAKLPPNVLALTAPLKGASFVLLASNGKDLLSLARGDFQEPPPGATLIGGNLAIAGSPSSLRAATAQHATGHGGAPDLLAHATSIAAGQAVWIVAWGDATLPLAGDAANLNRLLHATEYSSFSARFSSSVELAATGVCRTPDDARRLEETIRAFVSLGSMASARQAGVASLLQSIQLRRQDREVSVTLSAAPDAVESLLGQLLR